MQVSPLCLGAMMFGAWGEPDHDESIRIIHAALDAGINFVDTADIYSPGRVGGDRRQGARRAAATTSILATKFHGPMDVAMGRRRRPQPARQLPPLDRPGGREQPAPAADRLDRPLPGAPPRRRRPTTRRRSSALTDLQRAGQDPRLRLLDVPGPPASSRRSGSPRSAAWAASSPSSRRTRMLVRGIEADVLPVAEQYGMGVIPWSPLAGGWLTGRFRKGQDAPETQPRQDACPRATTCPTRTTQPSSTPSSSSPCSPRRPASRWSTSRSPSCCSTPRVTAPIIGPRTMEQLETQLGAVDVTLTTDVLDRIDEIVPPGVTCRAATPASPRRRCRTRSCAGAARRERSRRPHSTVTGAPLNGDGGPTQR